VLDCNSALAKMIAEWKSKLSSIAKSQVTNAAISQRSRLNEQRNRKCRLLAGGTFTWNIMTSVYYPFKNFPVLKKQDEGEKL
jgi:hypothetical protein